MLSVSTQIAIGESLDIFEKMLESVSFADEILIFNMERTDPAALNLFKKYKTRVIEVKTPKVVESIRDRQIKEAKGDWVLIMDYDEVVTDPLKNEILAITGNLASCPAYAIPRDNFSLEYKLKHGGWERDYVVRLISRDRFLSWPTSIHSTPLVKGSTIKANHPMEHHKDGSLSQMVTKTNRYSLIEADQFFAGNLAPVSSITLIRKWWMESFRRGVLKAGLLDGAIGLIQSMYQGFSVFISYAKLYEKQQKESGK